MDLIVYPVKVFLNFIVLSAVPPPETKRPCSWGDHAMALMAAVWSVYLTMGSGIWGFQIRSWLSFPPEQNCCSSKAHLRPQISCLWPVDLLKNGELMRISLWRIVLSRDPVLKMVEFQAIVPTLFECPFIVLVFSILLTSQIWTSPLLVPKEKWGSLRDHETDVIVSVIPKSQSFVTFEFSAFQRYTLEESPTAKQFCVDQSIRLR